jgi:hypothetical protein
MFKSHPLLIFKGIDNVSPTEFINFVKKFDKDMELIDYHGITKLKPDNKFVVNNHIWHNDLLGHKYKLHLMSLQGFMLLNNK